MMWMALLAALRGGGNFVLGLSSLDPNPGLLPLVKRSRAKAYLVPLPWRLVEPELVKLEGLTLKKALEERAVLEEYSRGVNWREADQLVSALVKAGMKAMLGVGWGWKDMVPRMGGSPFCPDYAGYERYRARFTLHVRAVVERYDGDGYLDAPGGPRVEMWLPERALNEAIVEAALGKREPSTFSAPYSVWMYWGYLDGLMREGIRAVKVACEGAKVGLLLQTDAPQSVSAYVGKPTWEGALSYWASEVDFVVLEAFPNAWLPKPLKTEVIGERVRRALKPAQGREIYVLTGYPSGPSELGFSEELQAEFLREAVRQARMAGAKGLFWHTILSTEEMPLKPTAQEISDFNALAYWLEEGDIPSIVSMAMSQPWRVERLLSLAKTVENFPGLVRADGTKKPAWAVFESLSRRLRKFLRLRRG